MEYPGTKKLSIFSGSRAITCLEPTAWIFMWFSVVSHTKETFKGARYVWLQGGLKLCVCAVCKPHLFHVPPCGHHQQTECGRSKGRNLSCLARAACNWNGKVSQRQSPSNSKRHEGTLSLTGIALLMPGNGRNSVVSERKERSLTSPHQDAVSQPVPALQSSQHMNLNLKWQKSPMEELTIGEWEHAYCLFCYFVIFRD